ncbi:uncharacterized protein [Mytilus edulis]|uniref:uncharacterized protein n=1 Tax=Mytilus edulis TaxID=6550 RepID=UPI0039EFEA4B
MERLLYHWLTQLLLLAVYVVKDGIATSNCYFYPTHGIIHNWYLEGHFSQPTHNDKHHRNYQYSYSNQWNNNDKRSVFVKRSDIHARYCQYTGQHHHEGGKHHILVYDFHSQNRIWVDVTGGHCGSQDCCGSGQPVFNYCQSSPCQNGHHCNNQNTGYACHCTTGYHGNRREHVTVRWKLSRIDQDLTANCINQEPPAKKPRFKELPSKEEIEKLALARTEPRTNQQTLWGVQLSRGWLTENKYSSSFQELDETTLNDRLCYFYASLQTKQGNDYSKSALVGIRSAISRHLTGPPYNRDINIITD